MATNIYIYIYIRPTQEAEMVRYLEFGANLGYIARLWLKNKQEVKLKLVRNASSAQALVHAVLTWEYGYYGNSAEKPWTRKNEIWIIFKLSGRSEIPESLHSWTVLANDSARSVKKNVSQFSYIVSVLFLSPHLKEGSPPLPPHFLWESSAHRIILC